MLFVCCRGYIFIFRCYVMILCVYDIFCICIVLCENGLYKLRMRVDSNNVFLKYLLCLVIVLLVSLLFVSSFHDFC